MSSFTTELVTVHIDGTHWRVKEPFRYRVGSRTSEEIISVPVGYVTDFASIPKIFWMVVGHPAGKHGKAAVVHDYLYSNHIYSRRRADEIFYEAMGVSKVSNWKRKLMFKMVRWFGSRAYYKGDE